MRHDTETFCWQTPQDSTMLYKVNYLDDFNEFKTFDSFESNLPISYARHTRRHLNKAASAKTMPKDQYIVSETNDVTFSKHSMKVANNSLHYATCYPNLSFFINKVTKCTHKVRNVFLNAIRDAIVTMFTHVSSADIYNIQLESTVEVIARYIPAAFRRLAENAADISSITDNKTPGYSELFDSNFYIRKEYINKYIKESTDESLLVRPTYEVDPYKRGKL